MIIKIGKKCFLFAFLVMALSNKGFSKQLSFDSSNFYAEWNFNDDFKGDLNDPPLSKFYFNETYPLFLQVDENFNEKLVFNIFDDKKKLSFDFNTLIKKSKFPSVICPKICFFKTKNGLDILYYSTLMDSCGTAYLISFDFNNNKVSVSNEKKIGDLFIDIYSYEYDSLLNNIYKVFFIHEINNIQKNFYCRGSESLCGFWGDEIFGAISNNIITIDFLNTQSETCEDYKYLENKVSPKILETKNIICNNNVYISNPIITTKSFLTEYGKNYTSDNMKSFSDTPWVPSMKITDEVISIETKEPIGDSHSCFQSRTTGR